MYTFCTIYVTICIVYAILLIYAMASLSEPEYSITACEHFYTSLHLHRTEWTGLFWVNMNIAVTVVFIEDIELSTSDWSCYYHYHNDTTIDSDDVNRMTRHPHDMQFLHENIYDNKSMKVLFVFRCMKRHNYYETSHYNHKWDKYLKFAVECVCVCVSPHPSKFPIRCKPMRLHSEAAMMTDFLGGCVHNGIW